jgi:hypothetical protein
MLEGRLSGRGTAQGKEVVEEGRSGRPPPHWKLAGSCSIKEAKNLGLKEGKEEGRWLERF